MAAVHAVFSAIPHDTLVVDEAVSAGAYVRGFHRPARAGRYFFCRGGGLGWGMPAAVGVSLGAGRESVLCIVGDGAACYSPQALWTAATERLPVVFVVIDNGGYGILRSGLQARMGKDTDPASFVGTDIRGPEVSFAELGKAFGVGHHAVAHIDHLGDAVQAAVDSGEPSIVHFRIGDMV
jgi:benzoylformate decarboxylase